jgi:predicted secreted protein
VVLFAVLPVGTQPREEADEITGWRGVPARPQIARKLLATTLLSLLLWGAIMLVIRSEWLSFRPPA